MEFGGKNEGEADAVEYRFHLLWAQLEVYPELPQQITRPRGGTGCSIAVLDHRNTGGSRHDRRDGGHIDDGPIGVSPCADDVEHGGWDVE